MKNPLQTQNVTHSPITTIAGLLLVAAGIATTLAFGLPWLESLVPIAIGCLLMVSPDTLVSYIKSFLRIEDKKQDNQES